MKSSATSPEQYIDTLPEDRKEAIQKLRTAIRENLPPGFKEVISYVVPHDLYPAGYHCDTKLPLPFINLASQKNFIAIYHMGIYADPELLKWYLSEYSRIVGKKPDMGKSCLRFKKTAEIPYELIASLASKMTVDRWISVYESAFVKKS
jgi:uncharacterized protein YdhG (YjbR/CyaY superfamily)